MRPMLTAASCVRRRAQARIARAPALVLSAAAALGAAAVPAAGAPSRPPRVKPSRSVIRHDQGVVDRRWGNCAAFALHGCPFGAPAWTWAGRGREVLYAIDLRKTAGDSCGLGAVYFFDGRRLIGATTELAPHGAVAYTAHAVSSPGPLKFAVRYAVNPSASALCVQYGSAGTDTYVYVWSGRRMTLASGRPPRPPRVLAP